MKYRSAIFLISIIFWSNHMIAQSLVKEDSIYSHILGRVCKYTIYLPQNYNMSEQQFPVLYLLHGYGHSGKDWIKDGNLQQIADKLANESSSCSMIIVMPNASLVKNGYFNMEGWRYESFFFEEFMPSIEKKYRILKEKEHRAIAGFSMGGGGAIAYAIKHPDVFSCVYAMGALVGLPKPDSTKTLSDEMLEFGKSVLMNDCTTLLSFAHEDILYKLRQIHWFIDCGDDDFLLDLNFRFYKRMRKNKIPCELRIRNGSHNWEYWKSALFLALPYISTHLMSE